jgi:hypothetical protein
MRRLFRALRILIAVLAASAIAGASAPVAEPTHLKLIVGVTDDTAKWLAKPDGIVAFYRDLRLMAVRVTLPWTVGQTAPKGVQRIYLARIARMIRLNQRIVLSVYNTAEHAPVTPAAQQQYCGFLRTVTKRLPLIQDVQVWNEANSPAYWPASAGPAAYEQLLARCWDVLHRYPGRMNVISSTAPHHDPAAFILGLGDAYRASGRELPLFDTFGHNPYPENAAEPPSARHDGSGTIDEGDYETLIAVLQKAFADSGQPVPGTKWVGLWYVETGFQTVPPPDKRRFYRGRENDPHALPAVAPPSPDGTPAVDQATQLRNAILLAYCQPAVTGFLNFELVDEDRLGGWQSGVLWRDRTRKPSYATFKELVAQVRARTVDCSKVAGAPPPVQPPPATTTGTTTTTTTTTAAVRG